MFINLEKYVCSASDDSYMRTSCSSVDYNRGRVNFGIINLWKYGSVFKSKLSGAHREVGGPVIDAGPIASKIYVLEQIFVAVLQGNARRQQGAVRERHTEYSTSAGSRQQTPGHLYGLD